FALVDMESLPVIVFLDVVMPKVGGMAVARALSKKHYAGAVVFLSVSREYAFEAFDVRAFNYVLKTDDSDGTRFRRVFLDAAAAVKARNTRYIQINGRTERLNICIDDISYFEVRGRVCVAHFNLSREKTLPGAEQVIEFLSPLGKLENMLLHTGSPHASIVSHQLRLRSKLPTRRSRFERRAGAAGQGEARCSRVMDARAPRPSAPTGRPNRTGGDGRVRPRVRARPWRRIFRICGRVPGGRSARLRDHGRSARDRRGGRRGTPGVQQVRRFALPHGAGHRPCVERLVRGRSGHVHVCGRRGAGMREASPERPSRVPRHPSAFAYGEHRFVETSRVEPTCTEGGTAAYACSVCGESRSEALPALGHDWGDWETARESTEERPGVEQRTCRRCGQTEERELPLLVQVDAPPQEEPGETPPSSSDEGQKTPWYATEFFTAGLRRCGDRGIRPLRVRGGGRAVHSACHAGRLLRQQAEAERKGPGTRPSMRWSTWSARTKARPHDAGPDTQHSGVPCAGVRQHSGVPAPAPHGGRRRRRGRCQRARAGRFERRWRARRIGGLSAAG
ncbi:MAG: LytR/AlgR family response regulator transcription factor, partial [Eggerthellaceae bacterium]